VQDDCCWDRHGRFGCCPRSDLGGDASDFCRLEFPCSSSGLRCLSQPDTDADDDTPTVGPASGTQGVSSDLGASVFILTSSSLPDSDLTLDSLPKARLSEPFVAVAVERAHAVASESAISDHVTTPELPKPDDAIQAMQSQPFAFPTHRSSSSP